jgi:hypothetical protein
LSPGYSEKTASIDLENSRIGEILEPVSDTEFGFVGRRGIASENEQGLHDIEPAVADELEHGQRIKKDHGFSDDEISDDSYARFGFVPSRPPSAQPSVGSRYTSAEL